MPYSSKYIQEILNEILKNPEAAVAKQLLIPAEKTIVIMRKKELGIFDQNQQLQLTTEIINQERYLAKYDPIAFLSYINRFDLIREIFGKEERLREQIAVAYTIEKEKEDERTQQIINNEKDRVFLIAQKQQQENLWLEKDQRALVIFNQYQQFMQIEQEIHNNFYLKQIEIFDKVYSSRMSRISNALEIVLNDPCIASADKDALIKLHNDYSDAQKVIQNMPIHKLNGSIDSDALKRKSEAAEKMDDEFKMRFRDLFKDLILKYPEHKNLQQIYNKENKHVYKYKKELDQNKKELKEKLDEIKPHIQQIRIVEKEHLISSAQKLINILEEFDAGKLSEKQSTELTASMKLLNKYRNELNNTHNDLEIKNLINKFTEELSKLQIIGKLYMPLVLYKKFEEQNHVLDHLKNSINTNLGALETPADSFQQEKPEVNPTVLMRRQTQSDRASCFKGIQEAPKTEVVTVEGEIKETLIEVTSELSEFINKKMKQGDFNPSEVPVAAELQNICAQIASLREVVEFSKLESAYKLVDKLFENHPDLNDDLNQLDDVIKALRKTPRLGN